MLMLPDRKKPSLGDVLIIDDDKNICEILKSHCENMGCFRNILLVHDGSIASTKLRNQKFALILLDLQMPKKSGLDIMREFDDKSINTKNDIVVISGALDKTMVEKVMGLGVKTFLAKPFTEADFQEKVLKLKASKK